MRLYLGCALEDVEDPRIAQHPANRVFERITIAAVNLHRIVRRRPGGARGKQFRHPRLDITARLPVLGSGGIIGQLTRHHDISRHQRDLVGDPRKGSERLAELFTVLRIIQRQIQGIPRYADGACGGLDPGTLEGPHQLFEALSLASAQQALRRDHEPVKAECIFLHSTITEHFDLAAVDPGIGMAARPYRASFSASSIDRPA